MKSQWGESMAGGRGGGVFEFISQARTPRKGGNCYNKKIRACVCSLFSGHQRTIYTHVNPPLFPIHIRKYLDRLLLLQGRKNTLV